MMVGFINTTDTTLLRDFDLELNSHFKPGTRAKNGTPLPLDDDSKRSIPPKTTVSSFRIRMMDSNLLVVEGGG